MTTQHHTEPVKLPGYHTTILLRAILLILVIAAQIAVPLAGRPLVCGSEFCEREGAHPHVVADAAEHDCIAHDSGRLPHKSAQEQIGHAGNAKNASGQHTPDHQESNGCAFQGCSCCVSLMLPGISRLPESEQAREAILSPLLLGDPITRGPLPLDHPPC